MVQPLATAAGRVRRSSPALTRVRFGQAERAALAVSALYVAAAAVVVGALGLPSSEAVVRGAHLGSLFDGFDTSLLAAGLERPPILTVLGMPFALVPGLRADGLAVALGAATLGGATVLAAYGLARWSGMTRGATVLYVTAFALHPLMLFSGAVGLPEALYSALLLTAVGQFMRWLDRESVGPVIGAGAALGIAFLVRYNSIFVVATMAAAFWWIAANRGAQRERGDRAQATWMAFSVPVVFTAGLWMVISWFPHGDAFEFLRLASNLSQLGSEDLAIVRRMDELRLDVPAVLLWVGVWTLLLAPLSVVATVAIAAHATARRSRESAALAVVLASVVLPEVIALLTGAGQAHVTHLFVAVVPAFAAVAYLERRIGGGARPGPYDTRRRRVQLGAVSALAIAALASTAVLPLLPAADAPAPALLGRIVDRERLSQPSAEAVARWIRENARPGDVVVDPQRSAEVMLATGSFDRFRTPADEGDQATLFDPFGLARFILVRRPVRGAGAGIIERAHPGLYEDGASWVSLAFESDDYRIYVIEGSPQR